MLIKVVSDMVSEPLNIYGREFVFVCLKILTLHENVCTYHRTIKCMVFLLISLIFCSNSILALDLALVLNPKYYQCSITEGHAILQLTARWPETWSLSTGAGSSDEGTLHYWPLSGGSASPPAAQSSLWATRLGVMGGTYYNIYYDSNDSNLMASFNYLDRDEDNDWAEEGGDRCGHATHVAWSQDSAYNWSKSNAKSLSVHD